VADGWVKRPNSAPLRPDRFSECRHAKVIQAYWDGARMLGQTLD
jgi:hypothetical protein